MTAFAALNTVLSLMAVSVLVYKLRIQAAFCTVLERVGIGIIGAALVLNIAPIIRNESPFECRLTPFDDWASMMLRIGLIMYFGSRILRHWHSNWLQAKYWESRKDRKVEQ